MRTKAKFAIASIAAALLAGCASGWEDDWPETPPAPEASTSSDGDSTVGPCTCVGLGCLFYGCRQEEDALANIYGPAQPEYPVFTSWASRPALVTQHSSEIEHQFDVIGATLVHSLDSQGAIVSTLQRELGYFDREPGPDYDAQRRLHSLYGTSRLDTRASFVTLAPIGQPGIDVATTADRRIVMANPYALGWNYQTFGFWNEGGGSYSYTDLRSYGAATPGSAVPSAGSAEFTGKLAGFYVSPAGQVSTAVADLRVGVDFGARTLGFASSGTKLTSDLRTATPAPHLDISGTLHAPAGSTFGGTLANAGGTMSGSTRGRFYGPAAQELGGVFAIRSSTTTESFAGAYGAKR